jgi:cytochrome c553
MPLGEVYGTPWPLDEWFHLCVYDPAMRRHGIYLVDAFGNRELIHREPELSCLDPIPLRARPRPPVIPRATLQAAEDRSGPEPATGTVAVVNIYESDFAWPAGTKIAALRVIQLYPKSTWHMNEPMMGRGAESLARGVVGEVPVAADGSVHFELEAGVPVYFQAVDADGLAVQSMRSATYVHPGGRLTCVGCHERKDSSPATATAVPLAWQEPPARLAPAPEGALPLSFPRLVQPVLDRHCVACHDREAAAKAPDLSGKPGSRHGWSAAFESLLPYAWALNGGNGIFATEGGRSQAGKLGARVAPLLRYLGPEHHGVELSAEDRLRITLWLDANSNFFGAYHDTAAQAAGERVEPEVR